MTVLVGVGVQTGTDRQPATFPVHTIVLTVAAIYCLIFYSRYWQR